MIMKLDDEIIDFLSQSLTWSLQLFYFAMFLSTAGTSKLNDRRELWHSGWWSAKLFMNISLIVLPFLLPAEIISIYGQYRCITSDLISQSYVVLSVYDKLLNDVVFSGQARLLILVLGMTNSSSMLLSSCAITLVLVLIIGLSLTFCVLPSR